MLNGENDVDVRIRQQPVEIATDPLDGPVRDPLLVRRKANVVIPADELRDLADHDREKLLADTALGRIQQRAEGQLRLPSLLLRRNTRDRRKHQRGQSRGREPPAAGLP
ncbi:MAG: hypothetical protein ACYS0D_13620 [Planctomycetota bacterium]